MKKILIAIVFLSATFTGFSQNPVFKDAISFKYLFLDYKGPATSDYTNLDNYYNGLELSYSRNLFEFLNLNVPLHYGVVNYQDSIKNEVTSGIGANLQAQLWRPGSTFVPYVTAGVNGVYENHAKKFGLQIPVGAGIDIRVAPNLYVNLQSEYRIAMDDNRNNLHHGIGLKYLLGSKREMKKMPVKVADMDGDGIKDSEDDCPNIAGLIELQGCPDTDGDGLSDGKDLCPDVFGLPEFNGCPDTDGDGVVDHKDKCPNQKGTAENNGCPVFDTDNDGVPNDKDRCPTEPGSLATNGCPDTDGDGVIDKEDRCPTTAGSRAYYGCPDTDGDGLHDAIDKCPGTYGDASNGGCPVVKKEVRELLDFAQQAVQFDVGKSTLKSESFVVLNQILNILKQNPTYNLQMAGHTDSTGDPNKNLDLSERRAKACYDYLLSKGISPSRIGFIGYGEDRPIASNRTAEGKRLNRRVEFIVKFK